MLVFLFSIALVALSTPALAETPASVPADSVARARHLLSGYEYVPGPEELRAIPDLDRVLEILAGDPGAPGFVRARALSSFAAIPVADTAAHERAVRVLRAALADESLPTQLRRAAVKAHVARLGPGALPDVEPLLAHPELRLRDAAVEALARHVTRPAVRDALRTRLAREPEPALRERLSELVRAAP